MARIIVDKFLETSYNKNGDNKMILFSDRKKIEDEYKEWLKENPEVTDSPFNVISFMVIKGLVKDRTETDFYESLFP